MLPRFNSEARELHTVPGESGVLGGLGEIGVKAIIQARTQQIRHNREGILGAKTFGK